MYTLTKTFRFEASHILPHHDGKCSRLHGHSWVGHLILEGKHLDQDGAKQGMLVDFGDIRGAIIPILEDYLDHRHLNDSIGLDSPTSERIAEWLYHILKPRLTLLRAVKIEETCTSSAEYRP